MNPANINQAMVNRANSQYEIKAVNNRINTLTNAVNGVDVVFRENKEITGSILSDILSGTGLEWISAPLISDATIYEAPAPSSYIKNLRPSGMWKVHAINSDGAFIFDTYSPLESFVRSADGSITFNPLQNQVENPAEMNRGGNLPGAIVQLLTTESLPNFNSALTTLTLNIELSEVLNTSNLYFIQNSNLISQNFSGAQAQSFTLHFE